MKLFVQNKTAAPAGAILVTNADATVVNEGPAGAVKRAWEDKALMIPLSVEAEVDPAPAVNAADLTMEGRFVVEVDGVVVPYSFSPADLMSYFNDADKSGTGIVFKGEAVEITVTNGGWSFNLGPDHVGVFGTDNATSKPALLIYTNATKTWSENTDIMPADTIGEVSFVHASTTGKWLTLTRFKETEFDEIVVFYSYLHRDGKLYRLDNVNLVGDMGGQLVDDNDVLYANTLATELGIVQARVTISETHPPVLTVSAPSGVATDSPSQLINKSPSTGALIYVESAGPTEASFKGFDTRVVADGLTKPLTVSGPLATVTAVDFNDLGGLPVWLNDTVTMYTINRKLYTITIDLDAATAVSAEVLGDPLTNISILGILTKTGNVYRMVSTDFAETIPLDVFDFDITTGVVTVVATGLAPDVGAGVIPGYTVLETISPDKILYTANTGTMEAPVFETRTCVVNIDGTLGAVTAL